MLSCVIDGQAKAFALSGSDSLATMLNGLHGDIAKSGRFIASLLVNGEEVAGIEEETNRRLEGIDSIEITTESPVCLVNNILAESRNFIEGLQNYLTQVAGHFTSGSECADDSFAEGIQGLQWFVQMTDFIECTLRLDFQEIALNNRPVAEYVKSLNSILQEIVNAQEGADPVLLADILVYDLVPHLEEWKEIYNLFEGQSEGKPC
ncbi:MAG TPA: hypothetical protein VHN12_15085 [Geobacteraceae bacterium]|nr:hypothetical protein [Geobacteraceae bacterium]